MRSSCLGYGWTHTYNIFLKDNQTSIALSDENGAVSTFTPSLGVYASPPALDATLSKNAQGFTLRHKNGTQLSFSTSGRLASITDRNGNSQTLTYDGQGNLQTVADALGQSLTFTYNAQNRMTGLTDSSGRHLSFSYDDTGNLITSTDFAGNLTSYTYYSDQKNNHSLKTITFPAGGQMNYEYYGNNKVSKIVDRGGGQAHLLYVPLRNETVLVDERGFTTTYQYNSLGNLTRTIKPDGNYIDQVWNADAQLISRTDEAGFTTTFTYDQLGNLLTTTDPLGHTVSLTYEPMFNQVTSHTDAKGAVTKFVYDSKGNLVQATDALGNTSSFTYDGAGDLLTWTDPEGSTFSITYDASGNPIQARDAVGNVSKFQFDSLRRLVGATDALNNQSRLQYDSLDRIVQLTGSLGNSVAQSYDANGNFVQQIDPSGKTTQYGYDAANNLTQVTDALKNVTLYGYQAQECSCTSNSNMTSLSNAKGSQWTYTYDFRNLVSESRTPLGYTQHFFYDARGNLTSKTDANGRAIMYQYDALDRLTQKSFPDGTQATFSYDANGNVTSAANENVSYSYTYDALNRMTSVTDSRFGRSIQYSYDRLSRRKTMTDPDGGVTSYSYTENGLVESIINPQNQTFRFQYDAMNRRVRLSYPNNTLAAYEYDPAGNLTLLKHTRVTDGSVIAQFAYTYDRAGNRTSMTDLAGTHQYQYDDLYQLTEARHPGQPAESYRYDAAGNRLASATDTNYTYDAQDRLSAFGATSFAYDNNGNIISKSDGQNTTSFTYKATDQLTRVDLPGGRSAGYKYDPLGRRIEKLVGPDGVPVRYLYDDEDILSEMDADNHAMASYTQGPATDEHLQATRGRQQLFYYSDGLASISALADSTGTLVHSYTYSAVGASDGGALLDRFAFEGREWDGESGLYYFRNRYYDPRSARFISEDPIGLLGGTNRYRFVENNPVNSRDPFGLQGCSVSSRDVRRAILASRAFYYNTEAAALDQYILLLRSATKLLDAVTPDYFVFSAGYQSAWWKGGGFQLAFARNGNVYFGGGPSGGTIGPSGSLRFGYIEESDTEKRALKAETLLDGKSWDWAGQPPVFPISVGRTVSGSIVANEVGLASILFT